MFFLLSHHQLGLLPSLVFALLETCHEFDSLGPVKHNHLLWLLLLRDLLQEGFLLLGLICAGPDERQMWVTACSFARSLDLLIRRCLLLREVASILGLWS